jgi:hypothetical protein
MSPRDLVLAFLGRGPAARNSIIGYVMGRGVPYVDAEKQVSAAILELQRVGRIEGFGKDGWRLATSAAEMEASE